MNTQREDIFTMARRLMDEWYLDSLPGHRCLYWAHVGHVACHRVGIHAAIVGGTAYWHCNHRKAPDFDTFGAYWDGGIHSPGEPVRVLQDSDMTKEIHVWLWLPATKECVDFSVGELPTLASKVNVAWDRDELKVPYLWGKPNVLAESGAFYLPYRDATEYVHNIMKESYAKA